MISKKHVDDYCMVKDKYNNTWLTACRYLDAENNQCYKLVCEIQKQRDFVVEQTSLGRKFVEGDIDFKVWGRCDNCPGLPIFKHIEVP